MARALLTVVGSGTLLPSADRRSAAFHLAVADPGGGASLLLDCGSGALHGLAATGVEWRELDVVALSHYHPDHVSDLVPLLAAYRFEGRKRPLVIIGPRSLPDFLDRAAALFGRWVTAPLYPLRVVGLESGDRWEDPELGITVAGLGTPHTSDSLAFRVTGAWGSVGYTGDSGPSEPLAPFLTGCSVLIAECGADGPEVDFHLSPRDVAHLAEIAEPGLLVVTHVYPPRTPEEAASMIAERYAGRVEAGYDGMRVHIDGVDAIVAPESRQG